MYCVHIYHNSYKISKYRSQTWRILFIQRYRTQWLWCGLLKTVEKLQEEQTLVELFIQPLQIYYLIYVIEVLKFSGLKIIWFKKVYNMKSQLVLSSWNLFVFVVWFKAKIILFDFFAILNSIPDLFYVL